MMVLPKLLFQNCNTKQYFNHNHTHKEAYKLIFLAVSWSNISLLQRSKYFSVLCKCQVWWEENRAWNETLEKQYHMGKK